MRTERESAAELIGRWPWPLAEPWAPWIVLGGLLCAFWGLEAMVHAHCLADFDLLVHLLRPSSHEFWMRLLTVGMMLVVAVSWSVSLRLRARQIERMAAYQQRLADLSAHLASGDAQERRMLALELHEDVGQSLAAARLFLESVEGGTVTGECSLALRSVERILDRAVADCRDIALRLSPPVLDEYGLESALESLAGRVGRESGKMVRFRADAAAGRPLCSESVHVFFQALAEIVEGAVRDPATTAVSISLAHRDVSLEVSVHWDAPSADDFWAVEFRVTHAAGAFSHATDRTGTDVSIQAPFCG